MFRRFVKVIDLIDYNTGEYAIECNDHPFLENGWCIPAWEERGLGDLSGPFATKEAAQAALNEHRDYLAWRDYHVV